MSHDPKPQYEAPAVTVIGSFEDVTQATSGGSRTDQTFPAGTPISVIIGNGLS